MNKWLNIIQSTVLPPLCILCGDAGSHLHTHSRKTNSNNGLDLCISCRNELPLHTTACARCAEPLAGLLNSTHLFESLCGRCQSRPPAFERCQAMLSYHAPANHLLQRLKFNGRLEMARVLGELMADWVEKVIDSRPDSLIPMPLHKHRLRERGFNQAVELARPIVKHLGLHMELNNCIRTKTTTPQSDLSRKERIKNVKGAFEVLKPVSGHVVIIDDVMTTGSTAHELAKTLHKAGATSVGVWVCARA
jgi:ComF family protein